MRDPDGYREAANYIDSATPEQRKRMADEQTHLDSSKATFEQVLNGAIPSGEGLHDLLLANLTVRPHWHVGSLALVWMQCQPRKWLGHNPASCVDVAEMINSEQDT